MKKLIAILAVMVLALAVSAAPAEEAAFTIRNNVTFGMNMDDVIATETARYHEIDDEHTHGGITFTEVEYEHVTENNIPCDVKYLFVTNELVAVRFSYEARDIGYEQLKADLTAQYGEFGIMEQANVALGNGVYAVDDDGRPEGMAEATIINNVAVVIEKDEDDIEVTILDLSADYIKP